jgi:hypothetical protein
LDADEFTSSMNRPWNLLSPLKGLINIAKEDGIATIAVSTPNL